MDFHKLLHKKGEEKKPEEEKPAFEVIPPFKSTSEIPARLLEQKVGRIDGKLVWFNKEMFPQLAGSAEGLAKQLCIFADYKGAFSDGKLKAYSNSRDMILPVQFKDKDGRAWHLAEVLGAGLTTDAPYGVFQSRPNGPIDYVGEDYVTHGLFDKKQAEADRNFSTKVREEGGHTSMPFMILEIDKIITETGEMKPIKELQEEGKISKSFYFNVEGRIVPFQPVLYVRLSSEVRSVFGAEKSDFKEIAEKSDMDIEAFRRQLTERAAKTLAIIHDLGASKPAIWGDIHLDGSIVDYHDNIKPNKGSSAREVVTAVQTICNSMPILNEKYADNQFQASLLLSSENLSKESLANIEVQVMDITSLFLETYRASRKSLSEEERKEMLEQFGKEDLRFTGSILKGAWTVEFSDKPKPQEKKEGEKSLTAPEKRLEEKKKEQK